MSKVHQNWREVSSNVNPREYPGFSCRLRGVWTQLTFFAFRSNPSGPQGDVTAVTECTSVLCDALFAVLHDVIRIYEALGIYFNLKIKCPILPNTLCNKLLVLYCMKINFPSTAAQNSMPVFRQAWSWIVKTLKGSWCAYTAEHMTPIFSFVKF